MSDENERSVASAGSVEPVAWAVMDGTKTLVGYHSCSREKAEAWASEYGFPDVAPLYRSPTLTDAEREAVDTAEASLMRESTDRNTPEPVRQRFAAAVNTLRRLLDRTK